MSGLVGNSQDTFYRLPVTSYQVISYLLWSFCTHFLVVSDPVTTISYPGHFVPILVISYLGHLGTKWLHGGQFVPKSFRTFFWSFHSPFGHFVTSKDGWMDRWMDWRTDGRTGVFWLKWQINVLLLIVTQWNSLSFLKSFNNCQTLLSAPSTCQNKDARRQSLVSLISMCTSWPIIRSN